MADEDVDELGDQVHDDLATRLASFGDGYMVTKYLAMVEVIGSDGERSVVNLTTRDMRAWDSLGLLEYGRQIEQAGLIDDDGQVS